MPAYVQLLDERLTYTGRHRRQPAWQKYFKKEWNRCARTPITNPDDEKYNPLPYRWVCSCPAFAKNRFLVCKHLVQSVHQVPARFFLQVSRERSCPVWRHPDLRPLHPPGPGDLQELTPATAVKFSAGIGDEKWVGPSDFGLPGDESEGLENDDDDLTGDGDLEDDDSDDDKEIEEITKDLKNMALQLRDLADVIDHNAQYADPRTLNVFAAKTKGSVALIKKIQKKERHIQSRTTPHLPNFDPAFADIMFIHTRPRKVGTVAP